MNNLKVNQNNHILTITLSRPAALNALNVATLDELELTIKDALANKDISGIIITGDGEKAFVAGADIKEIASLNKDQAFKQARKGQDLFKMIEDSPKPVIAAVNGFALGGGCELAMSCHIRIATENAKFGQPEVNLGLIPGYGGTQRLTQLVGRGKALELLMTADMISAADAKTIGLVNHVVSTREELMTAATDMLTKILSKGPLAIAGVIKSVNAGFAFEGNGYQAEAENFAACTTTYDFKEGTSAFIEKRKSIFKGE
ncbi:MAG TPA: enoyl-CoA hydratase-related protein [Cyclobacteriaceae bacterium]